MLFSYFQHIEFAYPVLFWLLLLIPVLTVWYVRKQQFSGSGILVSQLPVLPLSNWKVFARHGLWFLRMLTLALVIVALAQPRLAHAEQKAEGEGIDIVLCLDVSGSMMAQDFSPNRLEAAKKVAINFVSRRLTDRIGVVIFAGESFTQCPLTTDRRVVISSIQNIHSGLLEDGTAIGSGLATSVDRLRHGSAQSKIVLLLTDGENNGGAIDPNTAKEIARSYNVKVYTIGVGSEGYARMPRQTLMGVVYENEKVTIDEKLMQDIAQATGGQYFRAKDDKGLESIYAQIDQMEKTTVEISHTVRYEDRHVPIVLLALCCLMLEMILRYTILRKFP